MMFARFKVLAVGMAHVSGHADDTLNARREPAPVGEAFEHANGEIAVYLDALPVSGRMLLQPVDDLRAKPVRRGAIGGTAEARLRMLEEVARRLYLSIADTSATGVGEAQARGDIARLLWPEAHQ